LPCGAFILTVTLEYNAQWWVHSVHGRRTVQKRLRKCFIYFPRFPPSDLHWGTQHQSLESLMGLSIFTVNDVVFTFTSGVATQTGSNDACSLRQITWSINEKTGVSAGMEMTRKYRIILTLKFTTELHFRFTDHGSCDGGVEG
jgi:hypothetical protein